MNATHGLADFCTAEKPPVPAKLDAVEFEVKRGYSGEEVVQFHTLVNANQFEDALSLITSDGAAVWGFVENLTAEHASTVLNKLFNLSELVEGNLLGVLPGFAMNPGGAPLSPESTTTTE